MAELTSTAHVYAAITQLAYTESQMAIHPRSPFDIGDRNRLGQQATEVANCAARFRQKNSASIDQQALFAAQAKVNTAQTMFDMINNTIYNSLSEQQVLAAVTSSIQAVDGL